MNILLIQPPDAPSAVPPRDAAYGHTERFVPSWNLLCLRSYLLNRTRFGCEFVDTRFFKDPEKQLAEKIRATPHLKLAVIETSSLSIGPAATMVELIQRIAPDLKIAISGQHPSQFPEKSDALPGVDFALCGDPEPILRNLMEFMDVESRLQRAPGLRIAGLPPPQPYWLPDLKSLSLPDWTGVDWGGYSVSATRQGALAELRVARGHTKSALDRAHGGAREPLRIWPLDRVAALMQRCASTGIVDVFIADPPGFWTDQNLVAWCRELDRARNRQSWSFQMLPTVLNPAVITELQFTACRRIEVIFPSADMNILARYGCTTDIKALAQTFKALQSAGIEVDARAWVGGPEETKGEDARILRLLRHLRFCPFSLQAFPVAFDAPLYDEVDVPGKPSLDAAVRWARDPWMEEKPTVLWGEAAAVQEIQSTMLKVERAIRSDIRHRIMRTIDGLRTTRAVGWLESTASGLLRKPSASR